MTSVKLEYSILRDRRKSGCGTAVRSTKSGEPAVNDSLLSQRRTGQISEEGLELEKMSLPATLGPVEKTAEERVKLEQHFHEIMFSEKQDVVMRTSKDMMELEDFPLLVQQNHTVSHPTPVEKEIRNNGRSCRKKPELGNDSTQGHVSGKTSSDGYVYDFHEAHRHRQTGNILRDGQDSMKRYDMDFMNGSYSVRYNRSPSSHKSLREMISSPARGMMSHQSAVTDNPFSKTLKPLDKTSEGSEKKETSDKTVFEKMVQSERYSERRQKTRGNTKSSAYEDHVEDISTHAENKISGGISRNGQDSMKRYDMDLQMAIHLSLSNQLQRGKNSKQPKGMKSDKPATMDNPFSKKSKPLDKTSERRNTIACHTNKQEPSEKNVFESKRQLLTREDNKSPIRGTLKHPLSAYEDYVDETSPCAEDKLEQQHNVIPSEAVIATDKKLKKADIYRKRKRLSLNENCSTKPDAKKTRKTGHIGILCSENDSEKILDSYFTSLIQRPTLYSYNDEELPSTVETIPPNSVIYIIVNESFFRLSQIDISATKRMLNSMMEKNQQLYCMNFLHDRDDFMEVKYSLPRAIRESWIDKESFLNEDIKSKTNNNNYVQANKTIEVTTMAKETNSNVQVGNNNTMRVKTETKETNTNLQVGSDNTMEVNSEKDVTSTQFGGNTLYEYRTDSTFKSLLLTIRTPTANRRLDVTVKKQIDDNLRHINVDLQELKAEVTSTELGSVIIRVKLEEGKRLGNDWLKKLITTILSEKTLSSLPVGTRMEVNMQASLSLKPLDVTIFETRKESDESTSLLKEVSKLLDNKLHDSNFEHKVAAEGSPVLLDKLLQSGIDVNKSNDLHETLLHTAVKAGNVGAVKLLINNGADITRKDINDRTPLHLALMTSNEKCKEDLMRVESSRGSPAVEITDRVDIKSASFQIVQSLLVAGADINAKDRNSSTPLHAAAVTADVDILNLLLRYEPNVRSRNHCGQTALHLAMVNGNFRFGFRLAEYDQATVDFKDNEGNTPLHGMAHTKSVAGTDFTPSLLECTKRFIHLHKRKGINAENVDGNSPLLTAILRNNLQIAHCLIKKGADVTIANLSGMSVLHALANSNTPCLELTRIVLEKGAYIDAKDNRGDTPLHISVLKRDKLMTRELLASGANEHALNNWRKSPSNLVEDIGSPSLKAWIGESVQTQRRKSGHEKSKKSVAYECAGVKPGVSELPTVNAPFEWTYEESFLKNLSSSKRKPQRKIAGSLIRK